MTTQTSTITPITGENLKTVKSLFQSYTPAALGPLQKADKSAHLSEQQEYNGHRLECWHHDTAGQIGVIHYADGRIGVFANQSVLVAVNAGNAQHATGIAILMVENGQSATKGEVGQGLKTAKVIDNKFAGDIMHVMQHEVGMPHRCASQPTPGK